MTLTDRIAGALACAAAALALMGALAFASGCKGREAAPAAEPKLAPVAEKSSGPAADRRTQQDLSRELDEVGRRSGAIGAAYAAIRRSWLGKRYRWQVRVVPALCSQESCNVVAFELTERAKGMFHGWMPKLVLDGAGHAAIQKSCAGRESCLVQVEGTLSKFVLDTENPTSLEFSDVRIL